MESAANLPTPGEMHERFRRDGYFLPTGLQHFGVVSDVTFPAGLSLRERYNAPFVILPISFANSGEVLEGQTPLAACAAAAGEPTAFLAAIQHTSDWAPKTIGAIRPDAWRDAATAAAAMAELRLAAFLGLNAALVPLPMETPEGAAFNRAVQILSAHLRSGRATALWVHCDASSSAHRVAFTRLRRALLWGDAPPTDVAAREAIRPDALHRVAPFLYFGNTFGALPTDWLGETVVAFAVPPIQSLARVQSADPDGSAPSALRVPSDVMPLETALWATPQPPFLSLVAFIVELLRRRAAPAFTVDFFLDRYAMLSQLHAQRVVDEPKDRFANFEDVLQLPLQPLGHMLPSGVYEVFEQDRVKYTQYGVALRRYFTQWAQCGGTHSHAKLCQRHVRSFPADDAARVVLLGAGRGPLLGVCLAAATDAGVRVQLVALEKNPEAADFLRYRLHAEAQWRAWSAVSGHRVSIHCVDGRRATPVSLAADGVPAPTDWGLCDLVVSELLGSWGDNELSPECVDGLRASLAAARAAAGWPANPRMVSIPRAYTAWLAPLHSAKLEESVAEASIAGLTVCPRWCPNRHAALFHSMFVSNVCRGHAIAPPQPCWSFCHFGAAETDVGTERDAELRFRLAAGGRCSGFVGFFDAVLFDTDADGLPPTTLTTLPNGRTRNMFSWFPAVLAIGPKDAVEVEAGDVLRVTLQRRVAAEEERVWYAYAYELCRGEEEHVMHKSSAVNEGGWAASVLLSA